MLNRLISKKTLIALGAVALLGASAGAQAWDGYPDHDYDGRRVEVHQDWRELQHDRLHVIISMPGLVRRRITVITAQLIISAGSPITKSEKCDGIAMTSTAIITAAGNPRPM